MKDYKAMYNNLCGQMEMSAEMMGMATEFLRKANFIISEIVNTNDKTIKKITEKYDKTIAINKETIDEIVESNTKSMMEMTNIISLAAVRFDMIKVKMEDASKKIEETYKDYEED